MISHAFSAVRHEYNTGGRSWKDRCFSVLIALALGVVSIVEADDIAIPDTSSHYLRKYCFDCHSNDSAEANVN